MLMTRGSQQLIMFPPLKTKGYPCKVDEHFKPLVTSMKWLSRATPGGNVLQRACTTKAIYIFASKLKMYPRILACSPKAGTHGIDRRQSPTLSQKAKVSGIGSQNTIKYRIYMKGDYTHPHPETRESSQEISTHCRMGHCQRNNGAVHNRYETPERGERLQTIVRKEGLNSSLHRIR